MLACTYITTSKRIGISKFVPIMWLYYHMILCALQNTHNPFVHAQTITIIARTDIIILYYTAVGRHLPFMRRLYEKMKSENQLCV